MSPHPPIGSDLLSLCAALRWFDAALLRSLLPDHPDIPRLLQSPLALPVPGCSGRYCLDPATGAAALAALRGADPRAEIELHAAAWDYHVARADDGDCETECFYHLRQLFFTLVPLGEFEAISQMLERMAQLTLGHPRHAPWLSLYVSYAAVRQNKLDEGVRGLVTLLPQAELEDEIRLHGSNALGQARLLQSRYEEALGSYEVMYATAQRLGDVPHEAVALLNQSMIYNELERYDKAFALARRSLETLETLTEPRRRAYALYAVGLNALYLGNWDSARTHLAAAIAAFTDLDLQSGLAPVQWSYGLLYHLLGEPAASRAAYEAALALAETHGLPSVALDALIHVGFLCHTQGQWPEALAYYDRALELLETAEREQRRGLIYYLRGHVFRAQGQPDAALAAYRSAVECTEAFCQRYQDERIKLDVLGSAQHFYQTLVLWHAERGEYEQAFNYVERARSRALLDALSRKRGADLAATLGQPILCLATVQQRLPAGSLLLEYFTTGVLPNHEHFLLRLPAHSAWLRDYFVPPPQIWLFAITNDSLAAHRLSLDPNKLQPLAEDSSPVRRLLKPRRCQALYEELIGPVEALTRQGDIIYIVPHGPLHYVPFMALQSASGAYLVERDRPPLAFAPSATVLIQSCLERPRRQLTSCLSLGFNDPQANLVFAEAEAKSVAAGLGGDVWTGAQAKSQLLLGTTADYPVLHIACHAEYKPEDPLASTLSLGTDDTLSAYDVMGKLGLRAELVTLSACSSGLSSVVADDELLGFQRAFLYAGAATVIGALWEARDSAASLLMARLYDSLARHPHPALALRDAVVIVRSLTAAEAVSFCEGEPFAADPAVLASSQHLAGYDPAALPFASPDHWAPFLVIGRG